MRNWKRILAVAAVLGGGAAMAQEPMLATDIGMSAEIGGGVIGFVSPDITSISSPGGTWTARLTLGTRSVVGGELAYIGSAQAMDAFGLADSATLVTNGAEGLARLNFLTGIWQPFIFAGLGWRNYFLTNAEDNTAGLATTTNTMDVPLGAGLAYRFEGLVADVRGTYRQAFFGDLLGDSDLSSWSASARVGFEF